MLGSMAQTAARTRVLNAHALRAGAPSHVRTKKLLRDSEYKCGGNSLASMAAACGRAEFDSSKLIWILYFSNKLEIKNLSKCTLNLY